MRAAADYRKENAGFHPGCCEEARTRRKSPGSSRIQFPSRFSNLAAQNAFHAPARRSGRLRRLDPRPESLRISHLAICKLEPGLRSATRFPRVKLWHLPKLLLVVRRL